MIRVHLRKIREENIIVCLKCICIALKLTSRLLLCNKFYQKEFPYVCRQDHSLENSGLALEYKFFIRNWDQAILLKIS